MPHPIDPLPLGCPWADWTRPNLKWCEQLQCSYIVTPSNTWSNLFYVFAALLMWLRVKAMRRTHPLINWFPFATFIVGLSSFCYHASYTLAFQYFDFFGMYCYLVLAVELSLVKASSKRVGMLSLILLPILCGLTLVCTTYKIPYQLLVLGLIITVLILNAKNLGDSKLSSSLGFIVLAASFSAADQANVFCTPESWIQGHALWHMFGSASTYQLFSYFVAQNQKAANNSK